MNIRIKREDPVDIKTTVIESHPVSENGTEFVISQTVYNKFKKRYSPSRMMFFTLSPEERKRLITELQQQEKVSA